jgi:alcohol dehydrogenase
METISRAAVLKQFATDFSIDKVKVMATQKEVLVKVTASGICGRDLVIWKGGFRNLSTPLILGHENYGEMEGKPVGVLGNISCGQCEYCRKGEPNLCEKATLLGEGRMGGYADVIAVPRINVFNLPDREYKKYAAAVCPVATAIHASKLANVKQGSRVLVTGAGGGVGIHTLQLLRRSGAEVIAQTSEEKAKIVQRWADKVITSEQFAREAKGVDAVIELVGAPTLNESIRAVSKKGVVVVVGNVTGEPLTITRPALLVMRELEIIGSASYTPAEVLTAVNMIHEGTIEPVYREYSLEDINSAYRDLREKRVIGRAILVH